MKRLIAPALFFALQGCTVEPQLGQHFTETVPTCHNPAECDSKWAAARTWVINNADMKFQTYSADYMDTYNPSEASTDIAARVNKEPLGDGSYRITIKLWCNNMFGCGKSLGNMMQAFNDSVNAAYK